MSTLAKKLLTFARLLMRGDTAALRQRALYNELRWKTWLNRGRPFAFRKRGIRYVCHPRLSDSLIVSAMESTDAFELKLLRRWLDRGGWFVDGGANLGVYTAAAAQFVGPSGYVTAIDAGKRIMELLQKSMDVLRYRHVTCIHAALGDHESEVTFFEARPGEPSFSQSLHVEPDRTAAFLEQRVKMIRLSDVGAPGSVTVPAAVKIDVEGAEVLALAGTPLSWLSANGPLWMVEINPSALNLFGHSPADVIARFSDDAFEKWILPKDLRASGASSPKRPLTNRETWADSVYYNLIAVPRGSAHQSRTHRVRDLLG